MRLFRPVSGLARLFRFGKGGTPPEIASADAAHGKLPRVHRRNRVNRSVVIIGASLDATIAAIRLADLGFSVTLAEGERPLDHISRDPRIIRAPSPFVARLLTRAGTFDAVDDQGHALLRGNWSVFADNLRTLAVQHGVSVAGQGACTVASDGNSFQVVQGASVPLGAEFIVTTEILTIQVGTPKRNSPGARTSRTLDPRPSARTGTALLTGKTTSGASMSRRLVRGDGTRTFELLRSNADGDIAVLVSPVPVRARSGGWSLPDRDRLAIETISQLEAAGITDVSFNPVLPPLGWDGGLAGNDALSPLRLTPFKGVMALSPCVRTGAAAARLVTDLASLANIRVEVADA